MVFWVIRPGGHEAARMPNTAGLASVLQCPLKYYGTYHLQGRSQFRRICSVPEIHGATLRASSTYKNNENCLRKHKISIQGMAREITWLNVSIFIYEAFLKVCARYGG